jgi:hypothetical protein
MIVRMQLTAVFEAPSYGSAGLTLDTIEEAVGAAVDLRELYVSHVSRNDCPGLALEDINFDLD